MQKHRQQGFTLIELLMVLVIVAIITAVAAPAMRDMILNNRITSQANDLLGALYFARSEALKRNGDVAVCLSADGAACSAAGAADWNQGWIMWHDADGAGDLDTGEEILRVGQTLKGENTLSDWSNATTPASGTIDVVTFSNRGLTSDALTWVVCDSRGAAEGLGVTLNVTGTARISDALLGGQALSC